MATADLETTITDHAGAPKTVQIDGQTVTQRSISELVQAERYLASRNGVAKNHRGLRFSRVVNPGA